VAISVAGGVKPGKIIEVEFRLYLQLLVGKKAAVKMEDELDTLLDDAANKLEIERAAIKLRLDKQLKAKALYKAISEQLSHAVSKDIEHQLSWPEKVSGLSGVSQTQLLLLELLAAKEVNLARLRPLIDDSSWLVSELTAMINSPSSRHRRTNRGNIQVSDLKLILNYVGVENLRLLVPYFCLRHWLPSGNANVLWAARKLWRYSIISAIAAKALGQLHSKNVSLVYTCALLNQLGSAVVLNCGARMFEKHWRTWLQEASHSRDKEVYDAILATEFPANEIFNQVMHHGQKYSWQLLSLQSFDDSPITQVLKELDVEYHFSELSPEAAIVAKASCYAKVYLLEELKLIEHQEKRVMFDYYEFSQDELACLKGLNFRKLDLF
jgi:HD-like signal output (HDOD) protein